MPTTRTTLTVADLVAALNDERHLGWGYATREYLSESRRERLDRAVLAVANSLGLSAEDLFHWTNAKFGRHLVDMASSGKINHDLVRGYLNAEAVAQAKDF